jgi:hypothetical protein
MQLMVKPVSILIASFLIVSSLMAQKDSLRLICPFEHGSGREPKEAYTWNPPDQKVIMVSQVDTLIRSATAGTVTNVNRTEDSLYEVVIFYKDFYFWYYNVTRPLVKKGQVVKAAQNIGIYTFGNELEFRMFKDEDILDPRNLLECKIPKAE